MSAGGAGPLPTPPLRSHLVHHGTEAGRQYAARRGDGGQDPFRAGVYRTTLPDDSPSGILRGHLRATGEGGYGRLPW